MPGAWRASVGLITRRGADSAVVDTLADAWGGMAFPEAEGIVGPKPVQASFRPPRDEVQQRVVGRTPKQGASEGPTIGPRAPRPLFESEAVAKSKVSAPRPAFPPEAGIPGPARAPGGPLPLFVEPGDLAPGLAAALDAAAATETNISDADRLAFRRALGRIATDLALRPPGSSATLDTARAAQSRVTALPDALLDLATERTDGIGTALGEIVSLVRSVAAEELLPTGIGGLILRRLAPPEERLRNAIAGVDLATAKVRAALPVVEARHGRVLVLLHEEEEARRDLLLHLRAGETFLAWRKSLSAGARAGTNGRDDLATMEEEIASLRLTFVASAGDEARLNLLRDADKRLLTAARTDIPELVAAWKRGCSTVLVQLAMRNGRALGTALDDFLATRNRLIGVIEAATR